MNCFSLNKHYLELNREEKENVYVEGICEFSRVWKATGPLQLICFL